LLIGVVVGVVAPLGDLFESKIKRDAGRKDAGTLFGPHGGALDRLDAALFSLVAGYYLWLLLL
jgi:phosphatidate cytidylyltransferase